MVNALEHKRFEEWSKGRYALAVMFSSKTWSSLPYWVATGALVGAFPALSSGPGQAHPQSLLLGVGALCFGLGSQRAHDLIFGARSSGTRRLFALTGLAVLSLWAFSDGLALFGENALTKLLRVGALATIGACWTALAPPIHTASPWRSMLALSGGLLGALFPVYTLALVATAGVYLGARAKTARAEPIQTTLASLGLSLLTGFLAAGLWMASRTSLDASIGGFLASGFLLVLLYLGARIPSWKGEKQAILVGLLLIFSLLTLGLLPVLTAKVLQPGTPLFPRAFLLQASLMLGPALLLRSTVQHGGPSLKGFGAGLLLGAFAGAQVYAGTLGIAAFLGLACVLLAQRLFTRALGIGLLALTAISGPDANPGRAFGLHASWNQTALNLDLLTQHQSTKIYQRRQRFLQSRTLIDQGFGPNGSFAIFQSNRSQSELALDGILHQFESRSADTQRLLPHLAVALHPGPLNALVLGDPLGLITSGLAAQEIDRIHVAVPQANALRSFVKNEPEVANILLGATVKLIHGTPQKALRTEAATDLLLEMAHSPWADAYQGLPRKSDLQKRKNNLSNAGVYVLGVDLHWLTQSDLKGLISDFHAVFPNAWTFLPPKGADQLILCGWSGSVQLDWERFVQVLQRGKTPLAALDIRSPLDLADRALSNGQELAQLSKPAQTRRWMRNLSPLSPPLLPLFRNHAHPETLFPENLELAAILKERGRATSTFLQLLSDNAHGKLEEVFKTSRSLLQTEGGQRSLDPLVEPYLEGARAAIAKGRAQGSVTTAWDKARTNLTAALLLNANSAEAHALMGEVHLATGRLSPATQSFLRALELQPGRRDPLLGLGQIALQRKDLPSAETHLREAHVAHPKDWLPAYNLGAFLFDRGLHQEAESVLRKSAAWAENQHSAPHTALAQLFLSKGQATAALLEAHRAIGIEKNAMNAYVLGKAYFEVEQNESATQYFQRAILADPSFWQARAGMGVIYAESGDWERCIDAFERVLQTEPNNHAAQENRGRCQSQIKP